MSELWRAAALQALFQTRFPAFLDRPHETVVWEYCRRAFVLELRELLA